MNSVRPHSKFETRHQAHDNDDACEGCDGLKVMKNLAVKDDNVPVTPQQNTRPSSVVASSSSSASSTQRQPNIYASDRATMNATRESDITSDGKWRMREPPDIREVGAGSWTLLHTIAAYYPAEPDERTRNETRTFLNSFANVFPCKWCATDFQQSLKNAPPRLDSQNEFAKWLCDAHNEVNRKLGKPQFDCLLVNQRWRRQTKTDTTHDTTKQQQSTD